MVNIFTINRDYKNLRRKNEILQELVTIFRRFHGINREFNKHLIAELVQQLQDAKEEDTYEQELVHSGSLVNEINKLEEVVNQKQVIIDVQVDVITLLKEKLSKGGKTK